MGVLTDRVTGDELADGVSVRGDPYRGAPSESAVDPMEHLSRGRAAAVLVGRQVWLRHSGSPCQPRLADPRRSARRANVHDTKELGSHRSRYGQLAGVSHSCRKLRA